jgi:hypothetical protein
MNDIIQCREAPPSLSRSNGMSGELPSEYKNRPQVFKDKRVYIMNRIHNE